MISPGLIAPAHFFFFFPFFASVRDAAHLRKVARHFVFALCHLPHFVFDPTTRPC